jgi:MinD-like ATPase involved in chromosome partitioning or flagellar assembly
MHAPIQRARFRALAVHGLPPVAGALWLNDPADASWAGDPGIQAYKKDIAMYGKGANADDTLEGFRVQFERAFDDAMERASGWYKRKVQVVVVVLAALVAIGLNVDTVKVATENRGHFGDRVFRTRIPRTIRLAEAPGFGQPVTVFDPGSRGAQAYRRLANELLQRLEERETATPAPAGAPGGEGGSA